MHITNLFLHLCVLASTVSAFYPYVPDYKCIQDGNCADASKRGLSSELVEALGEKGNFEVKIKQRKAQANGQTHNERISHYVEHLISRFEKRESSYSIIPSTNPTLPNSAAIDQDGQDFSYTATMKFGSSGKELNMLIDSGASTTWVMGKACTDSPCTHHNTFGQDDSTTYVKTSKEFKVAYGTGEVNGSWVKDTVEFAGFKIPLEFGVGDKVSDNFNSYPMDGILGLAVVPSTDQPGFLSNLISQGLLKEPVFGVNLHRSADGTNDGSIVFGNIDNSKFTGAITYAPLNPQYKGMWMITSDDAGFNNKKGGLAGKKVVIDTGTSYCFIPPADAKIFYSTFPDAKVSSDGTFYTVPCDTTAPAQFTFGGVTYEVSAKDWVGGKVEGGRCTSNIFSRDATGNESNKIDAWLMGDTFLKNVYTVFDVGQQRIGFAKKRVSSSSTSSSVSSTSTDSSSTTSTGSPTTQTGSPLGGFTGFNPGDGDASTTTTLEVATTPSATNPPDSGAASLSAKSLVLFAASLMAFMALLF